MSETEKHSIQPIVMQCIHTDDVPSSHSPLYLQAKQSADFIMSKIRRTSEIALICGTGWDRLATTLEHPISVDYELIPHFPKITTVTGHGGGQLVAGLWRTRNVICMTGRYHDYEGHPPMIVTFPVRVLALLGVKTLIVTNSSGAVNPDFSIGDLMIIEDHISMPGLSGYHPLVGPNEEHFGPRFPDLSVPYDREWRDLVIRLAISSFPEWEKRLKRGIYVHIIGPSYETRAESRFLRMIGGDVVGMSTVPEVIVARHCGLRVLGLSLVTAISVHGPESANNGSNQVTITHENIVEVGRQVMDTLARFLCDIVNHMY
jgi:purine-nucleoside phosphorylase